MTKDERINLLSRICSTVIMSENDQESLSSLIKEMKDEPEQQFVTAYNIDKIISGNGNWRLCYLYNNYGNNTLLMLPSFEIDESEEYEVKAIMDMNDSTFEECLVIEDYIRSCPNTPFVIREDGFINCIQTLTDRLTKLMDEDGFSKLDGETSKFLDFLKVCRMIQNEDEGFAYEVSEVGWQNFVPKKPKKFDSNYRLLEDMYKDPYYPPHLIDILKASLTHIINILESGETDIDFIKREFELFINMVTSMASEFAYLEGAIESTDVISKDIKYIISYFDIDVDIKDIMKGLK